jgi:tetratricopeptide (TPR) repeat protein
VVRLLRITTDSPAVEATSTRCQAVLEAFRGRAAAARRMIESARRTVTELGLRHAGLEVEQFAGIVELIVEDPAAAEPHLRKAYNGFRRMGLDADTAETAALLGRACLALGRDDEASELCTESERLAGHALKASIAWRTLRAHLLARGNDHNAARQVAEDAVKLAERTDALVDHGDACFTLATVLRAAGDISGARAAAVQAVDLYERKGAAALADMARDVLGQREITSTPVPPEEPRIEFDSACARVVRQVVAAADRRAWDEFDALHASDGVIESRRKIVGFNLKNIQPSEIRRLIEEDVLRFRAVIIAVRGERLALSRLHVGTTDTSTGAPYEEFLQLCGIDEDGRVALQIWFDAEDIEAALAELDAVRARFEEEPQPKARRLENAAARVFEHVWSHLAARNWDAMAQTVADNYVGIDHRRVVSAETQYSRHQVIKDLQAAVEVGFTISMVSALAIRGDRLVLARVRAAGADPDAIQNDALNVVEIDADHRIAIVVTYDLEDFDAAIAELDARYLAGEAAAHAHTWSVIAASYTALNRRELPPATPNFASIDHRRGTSIAPGEIPLWLNAAWNLPSDLSIFIESAHVLNGLGAVVTQVAHETSQDGFHAEWRVVGVHTVKGELIDRLEMFDEADLDSAIARFEQLSRPAPQLQNAAGQVAERFQARFAAHDWDALAEMLAEDFSTEDRRPVVGVEARHGRDAELASMRVVADLGGTNMASTVIATRGARLLLTRLRYSGWDHAPDGFYTDVLDVIEIDTDERLLTRIVFNPNDIELAFAELDSRYLAGEAAPYARTWSVITRAYAALNQHEMPPVTATLASLDHRRGVSFAPGHVSALLANWLAMPNLSNSVEAVHRLSEFGAVVTSVTHETSHEGFEAEWRGICVLTTEGDFIDRLEVFDEADLDAAITRFEQLSQPPRQLENAAAEAYEILQACFAARDWNAMAEALAEEVFHDDRRRVVGSGFRKGTDAVVAEMSALAEIGVKHISSAVIATRGGRLILSRSHASGRDERLDAFRTDVLNILEVDAGERIAALVTFDPGDFEAAMAELDSRYLAGEAAPYARTWSVVASSYAALNRHELPPTTPDCVYADHRRETAFGPGDLTGYIGTGWDPNQGINIHVEEVHRLSSLGAIVTYSAQETSHEGFDAEWRGLALLAVQGEMVNRCEVFDEAELDTAMARFDELSWPTPRLENTATRVFERLYSHIAAGEWHAVTQITAENVSVDDRRRVVNAGILHGRDANIKDAQATVGVGFTMKMLSVMATRGGRLALTGIRVSGRDPDAIQNDALEIIQIDAEERVASVVIFDVDDIDAAFEELEVRYLAGEAAAYAHTWSVISGSYAAMNRNELFPTTPDWVNVDHRRPGIIEEGGLNASLLSLWKLIPDLTFRVEAVHRLSAAGAVCSHVARGISQDGFGAEWRGIEVQTVDGSLINRCEIFDEADLDAAIARFEELQPRLENVAGRVQDRFFAYFAIHDWVAIAGCLTDASFIHDRRSVVNAGLWDGRDVVIANMRALAVGGAHITSTVLATRGERLALRRICSSNPEPQYGQFGVEMLIVVEIDADDKIAAQILFDPDDVDTGFAELDTRYLAGEAAAHSRTWSAIARALAASNRHEVPPMTPNCVSIDHRRGIAFAPGDIVPYIRATWEVAPHSRTYFEAVHRLSDVGAVFVQVVKGTSPEGFAAEWREIVITTVHGDLINHLELFDDEDVDAALARFEELRPPAPRLQNAASQVAEQFLAHFAVRDWSGLADTLADNFCSDDRRRVVGAGVRHGRDAEMADLRSIADVGITNVTSKPIATRGERLVLTRGRLTSRDQGAEAYFTESFSVVEIDTDARIVVLVSFDLNDTDAAFEELETRYLAGEAAAHAQTWSLFVRAYAALNRGEIPATASHVLDVDHRSLAAIGSGDMVAYVGATLEDLAVSRIYAEAVHRLSGLGAVVSHAADGTSPDGFDAEWRHVQVVTFEGDRINRCEIFDESDLDAALERFDELNLHAPRLENAANQAAARLWTCFATRDWAAMAETMTDDYATHDHRRAVNAGVLGGRDANIASMRAVAELGVEGFASTVIATRGQRLALLSIRSWGHGVEHGEISAEMLGVVDVDTDSRLTAGALFDTECLDAAFEELDARYLAGEAAGSRAWPAIAQVYAALNGGEMPLRAPDFVDVDHRRGAMLAPGDLMAYLRAAQDDSVSSRLYVVAVHRLTDLGAVVTHVTKATSREGFEAEWCITNVFTVDGNLVNRGEFFDEVDLDAALARFEELQPQALRLENTASRVGERFLTHFADGDWDAMADILTENFSQDDRRRLVGAGLRNGRDAQIADMRAIADLHTTYLTSTIMATRGEHLALVREGLAFRDQGPEGFLTDVLVIIESNADERIIAAVSFDIDDIDAAFAELDARFLIGEAAAHAHPWSIVAEAFDALNRGELPAKTTGFKDADHRSGATLQPGDLMAYLRTALGDSVRNSLRILAVPRLTDRGAVVTHVAQGTTQEGFEAEWHITSVYIVEGNLISRCEMFDGIDLDAALARFEELHRPPRLKNAASEVAERFPALMTARHWDAMPELLAADVFVDDRRRGANAGIRHGRGAAIDDMRAAVDVGFTHTTSSVIATRGERLALMLVHGSGRPQQPDAFQLDVLHVVEINADGQTAAVVIFDHDNIDAAFDELEARYLTGEAAAHAHTWSAITQGYATLNRGEIPATTPDFEDSDRRSGASLAPGDLMNYIRAALDDSVGNHVYIVVVHRLTNRGAVVTQLVKTTSREGLYAEWRMIDLFTVDGDLISRCEMFDEADLDDALARFDELDR